ncbi:hypothetical protein ACFV1N_25470 [Streptosporangium canum]|uniref:hypothetical protein n=1 Tax=Streptosporangium canum TaxID=324952 RepID=UPI003699DF0E
MTEIVDELRRLATIYPYSPPGDSLMAARELRDRAYALAEQSRRPAYTRDLYLVTAWSCAILANASFDLGAAEPAMVHARTALHFGDLCDHRGVQVWAHGLQSLIAFWDGRPDEAIAIAEPVLDWPVSAGTASVRTAAIYARALAMTGRDREAHHALARVQQARDQVVHIDEPLDDPGGMIDFPAAKELYWRANTYLLLEQADRLADAETAAQESVRLYLQDPVDQQRTGELCHARLDLAAARWEQGHPEGAEQEIGAVVETLQGRYVESVVRRMDRFAGQLQESHGNSRLATRVLSRISAANAISPPALPIDVAPLSLDG